MCFYLKALSLSDHAVSRFFCLGILCQINYLKTAEILETDDK